LAPEDRQLRSEIRTLLQSAREQKHELASAGGTVIKELLGKANALHERITRPREEAIDAELFALVTERGKEYARKLAQGTQAYNAADFVRRIKAKYVREMDAQQAGRDDPSAFQWAEVGRTLSDWLRPAPVCFHMLGPMDAAPKAKRITAAPQRRRREPLAEAIRPEEVQTEGSTAATSKQETDRNMEDMWRILKSQESERAYLLELVMNHRSFAQTVENLFTLSFLVRDGRVELLEDQDGDGVKVVIKHRNHAHAGQQAHANQGHQDKGDRVQFIVALDMAEWARWKQVTDEAACLMPHREPCLAGGGGKEVREASARRSRESRGELAENISTKKRRK
jgi:non-structural maintenance of chromosomes element 4